MQIVMIPTPGAAPTAVQVEGDRLYVNGTAFDLAAMPETGPVRVEEGVVLVEYAKDGALAATQIGEAHDLRIVPIPEDQKPPQPAPTAEDITAQEARQIAAQRASLICRRWQLMLALGEARWSEVEAFMTGDSATWAMRQILDGITLLPRVSETADLIGYILDLDDAGLDELWRLAAAQVA